jgi:hypothetical protein
VQTPLPPATQNGISKTASPGDRRISSIIFKNAGSGSGETVGGMRSAESSPTDENANATSTHRRRDDQSARAPVVSSSQ